MLLGNLFGHRQKPEIYHAGAYVKSLTYVGVELEFSCVLGANRTSYWSWHSDGSVRGERPGELVLLNPTPPLFFDEAVNEYRDKIMGNVRVNDSCGMHVHIDVCDLTMEELRGVLLFYSVLERTIYKYCGSGRDNNNFCVPLWECWNKVDLFGKRFAVDNNLRYCGLNLAAIRKFGSIEFRMHPGIVGANKMARWVGLCASIKEYGRTCTVESLYNLLQGASAYSFLSSTLGSSAYILMQYVTKEDLMSGVMDGKEIYYSDTLRASNSRLSNTSSKRKSKSSYIPYDVWREVSMELSPSHVAPVGRVDLSTMSWTRANYTEDQITEEDF